MKLQMQYIYDENGKKTGVLVPIKDWMEIQKRLGNKEVTKGFEPSKYRGLLKNQNLDLEIELKELRDEWDQN